MAVEGQVLWAGVDSGLIVFVASSPIAYLRQLPEAYFNLPPRRRARCSSLTLSLSSPPWRKLSGRCWRARLFQLESQKMSTKNLTANSNCVIASPEAGDRPSRKPSVAKTKRLTNRATRLLELEIAMDYVRTTGDIGGRKRKRMAKFARAASIPAPMLAELVALLQAPKEVHEAFRSGRLSHVWAFKIARLSIKHQEKAAKAIRNGEHPMKALRAVCRSLTTAEYLLRNHFERLAKARSFLDAVRVELRFLIDDPTRKLLVDVSRDLTSIARDQV